MGSLDSITDMCLLRSERRAQISTSPTAFAYFTVIEEEAESQGERTQGIRMHCQVTIEDSGEMHALRGETLPNTAAFVEFDQVTAWRIAEVGTIIGRVLRCFLK